jgi:acetylornithine deacetylase/succinyl-diaminopimelate desuccinylase-like protein
MSLPAVDAVDLLEELVRIDSSNPASGGPGEARVAGFLAGLLADLGLDVALPDTLDGRPNVVATLPGAADAPIMVFESHMDTVATPAGGLTVERAGDRLVGRGACDTKGSAAAMVAAIAELAASDGHPGVVFAGVVDEEFELRGSRRLLEQLPPAHAAIVGEPTSLRPVRAHNGLARTVIAAHGRAAHSSRAQLGVNAIAAAARVVTILETRLLPVLAERAHELTGPALVTPTIIHGGVAANIVPDRCELTIDRRLAPGEDPTAALAELDALLDELRAGGDLIVQHEPSALVHGVETPADHPLVRAAEDATKRVLGERLAAGGATFGTDASNLWGVGGIPCVVLGPGSIDHAHTDHEWVPIEEVRRCVPIYVHTARAFAHRWEETAEERRP